MLAVETKIAIIENSADSLKVRFDLTNNSTTDILVLKRNTPLEGIRSDCLIVLLNGNQIHYDGYYIKRKAAVFSDYLRVKIGQTASNVIDISEAYDVSVPGQYEVLFNNDKLKVVPELNPDERSFSEYKASTSSVNVENEKIEISRPYAIGKQPVGQRFRYLDTQVSLFRKILAWTGLKKPKVVGGTTEQKKTIIKAHKNAYRYIKKAISKFKNDNRYRHWFGAYVDDRSEHVFHVLNKMKNRMDKVEFSYHIKSTYCEEDDYAFTTIGSNVIWLCIGFWEASDEGLESRAGTLVHEHSHATGNTDDFEYSREDCIDLAKSNPKKAIKNADNYEYYAESHFLD